MLKSALRITEACKETGLGRTSIYHAINSGALRACKYRRATIILREDLERFLKSLPTLGGAERPQLRAEAPPKSGAVESGSDE
jgi:excisionase family DNA binding protein